MKKLFIYLLFSIGIADSYSQFEQMILPADLKQETVITEPATLRKGFFRTSLNLSHSVVDKIFDDSGNKDYLFGMNGWAKIDMYSLNLSYGMSDRLMLGMDLPYQNDRFFYSNEVIFPGYDSSIILYPKSDGKGLSDISFSIDYQLIYRNEGKTSLKTQLIYTLPSGRKNPENVVSLNVFNGPTGNGSSSLDARLLYRQVIYPYSFSGYLSYKYNFRGSKIHAPFEEAVEFRRGNNIYAGGSFNIHLNEWIALMNELSYRSWWNDEYFGPTSVDYGIERRFTINYQPSLVFQVRRVRFFEVIDIPLKGRNLGADPGYIFGLQYIF